METVTFPYCIHNGFVILNHWGKIRQQEAIYELNGFTSFSNGILLGSVVNVT